MMQNKNMEVERMRTEAIAIYKYDELSDEGKEKALEGLYDLNVDYEWWQFVYEDAEMVGIEISEFDIDYSTIKGLLTMGVHESAQAIIDNHGRACDTHKLALDYYRQKRRFSPYDREEWNRALLEEYLVILKKEFEYLTSEEAIVETIRANDYEFTEDGKLH
jgi:hypothetical protein